MRQERHARALVAGVLPSAQTLRLHRVLLHARTALRRAHRGVRLLRHAEAGRLVARAQPQAGALAGPQLCLRLTASDGKIGERLTACI